jgi:uncharacterized protein YgiM (DUF1202 family)
MKRFWLIVFCAFFIIIVSGILLSGCSLSFSPDLGMPTVIPTQSSPVATVPSLTATPFPMPTVVLPPDGLFQVNSGTNLNVRDGAGLQYNIVGFVTPYSIIYVYRTVNGWGQVSPAGNQWVSMDYLEKVK